MPVLYVAGVVCYAAVEDVLQGVLPQEQVAEDAHLSGVATAQPQLPQVLNGVYYPFSMPELPYDFGIAVVATLTQLVHPVLIFFDEGYDSLAVVLWNVLGLVLRVPRLERSVRLQGKGSRLIGLLSFGVRLITIQPSIIRGWLLSCVGLEFDAAHEYGGVALHKLAASLAHGSHVGA